VSKMAFRFIMSAESHKLAASQYFQRINSHPWCMLIRRAGSGHYLHGGANSLHGKAWRHRPCVSLGGEMWVNPARERHPAGH